MAHRSRRPITPQEGNEETFFPNDNVSTNKRQRIKSLNNHPAAKLEVPSCPR
ncbi:uncharacterized protein G2W53_008006 [Senna tora]|uniref:Uncharacterized protein n=1 Tax=Senna tora TaxID=362788 RepID=A0A834X8J2_9FABA|nr:uncharacterized protein G2W53_008006 [Senna tora]